MQCPPPKKKRAEKVSVKKNWEVQNVPFKNIDEITGSLGWSWYWLTPASLAVFGPAFVLGGKTREMTQRSPENMAIKHPLIFSCWITACWVKSHNDSGNPAQWMTDLFILPEVGEGGMFLYSISGALSPWTVWIKTHVNLVVSSLLVWQWGCCEFGDFKTALCYNIHLGVGTSFWRFINLVLKEAYHRKCLIPYNFFSWPWFIGPWNYTSCFLITSSLSELSDSFCMANLTPSFFLFFFFNFHWKPCFDLTQPCTCHFFSC